MLKAKGARWLVAVVVAAAGFGLTACEPREGTGGDFYRDTYNGCDSESDLSDYDDDSNWGPGPDFPAVEPC